MDSAGNAYVTGYTGSSDFPTKNPLQPTYGGGLYDAFVAELNSTGSALVYSTYLGGSLEEAGNGIAVDCDLLADGSPFSAGAVEASPSDTLWATPGCSASVVPSPG